MIEKDKFLDLSRFKILDCIGSGAFSKVFRVKENSTGEICAAKILNYEIDDNTINSEEMLLLLREVNLMSSLNHPSILKFIGFNLFNFDNLPFPTIVTKFEPNGSLKDVLKLEASSLSPSGWDSTKKLINIYGIASGLNYLHLHDIIHRDMKPENILMDEYLFPKIADFGLSKITSSVSKSMNAQSQSGFKGTPIYMAPEILRDEPYTKSVDVYAFSIIVYEIMTGKAPFSNLNIPQLILKVGIQNIRPELTDDISIPFKTLIQECWSSNPEDRPTFEDIINELKTDKSFLAETIDEDQYYDYVDFIDSCKTSFDLSHSFHFSDLIKKRGKATAISPISIKDNQRKVVEQEEEEEEELMAKVVEKDENEESPILSKVEEIVNDHENKSYSLKASDESNNSNFLLSAFQKLDLNYMSYSKPLADYVYDETKNIFTNIEDYYKEEKFFEDEDGFAKYFILSRGKEEKVICKVINPRFLQNKPFNGLSIDQETRQFMVLNSAIFFGKIKHPALVKFFGFNMYNNLITFNDDAKVSPTFFLEFLKNKSLQHIIDEKIELTPVQRSIIMVGIASALRDLHKNHFVHCGLCPKVIWLDENFYPKIFSFDSLLFGRNESNIFYQSPNLFDGKFGRASEETDIFSLGRIMYYLITGSEPFQMEGDELKGKDPDFIKEKIMNENSIPLIPDNISNQLQELLKRCWDKEENRPISAEVYYYITQEKEFVITNEDSDFAKIDSYIDMIETWVSENNLMDLSIDVSFEFESTHFKTSVQEEIKRLDKIIQSNFCIEDEEDILSLLVSMAEDKSILKNDYLQKVIDFVSNAKSKGHAFADEFLNTVFGSPIAVRAERITFNIFLKDMEIANISGRVAEICQKAFYGFKCLTKVFIPNSVKLIGDEAFDSCSSLIFVNLPESIEQTCLGSGVFKNCTKLNYIKTPSKLTKIFDKTFKGDVSLTKVVLNEGLLEIGKEAFAGCKCLEIIEIPQTVEFIDDKAFDGCKNLKTVLLRGKKIELGKKVWSRKVHVVHI